MKTHQNCLNGFFSLSFSPLKVEDVLDDVPDGPHKGFMRLYLKDDWPYPRLNKYRIGQTFNVELNGVQQMCEVQAVDSSLIQVVFQVSIFKKKSILVSFFLL